MHRNVESEIGIHWLEDGAKYPYLRESGALCSAKRGWRKAWATYRHVVAVAELDDSVRTVQRRVYRRMWYFDDKLDPYPGKDHPSEAVNPDLIRAGQESPHGRRTP
jgi:hypothetical protein